MYKRQVLFEGKQVKIMKPSDASDLGIGMVHQEFMLIDGYEICLLYTSRCV